MHSRPIFFFYTLENRVCKVAFHIYGIVKISRNQFFLDLIGGGVVTVNKLLVYFFSGSIVPWIDRIKHSFCLILFKTKMKHKCFIDK